MVTGFFRLSATPVMLLLATTTTTLLLERGGATGSPRTLTTGGIAATTHAAGRILQDEAATTSELIDECSAEMDACVADLTCVSCFFNDAEHAECSTFFPSTTSTFGCEANMESACCLDNLNDLQCQENDSFLQYFVCLLEGLGCSADITCDDTSSSARATGTPASFVYGSAAVVVGGLTCAVRSWF